MEPDDLELLITVVVAAVDEQQARTACAPLVARVDGRVVRAGDCSDEEPGCWSVTVSLTSRERATHNVAAALARAVRSFVRLLGEDFPTPRVACEPPTAWTVLDDPHLLERAVPGAERLLVEAWAGGDPYGRRKRPEATEPNTEPEKAQQASPEQTTSSRIRLLLRVDVVTDRSAGAEWQARAVASRVARRGTITRVAPQGRALSVHLDLGSTADSPATALLNAVSSLGRSGWSDVEWIDDEARVRWSADPVPDAGITGMELVAQHPVESVWTLPE
ncbi:hypothetical protein [Umezawaea beigongshangensis]|uniref:hypothetical protein n=1 Tax=Umezawaea beigongshangensis TaxID=2780383 RepID=UPI0018F1FACC|nr:hypothetical protein [Umezawaea beigongshangensis]